MLLPTFFLSCMRARMTSRVVTLPMGYSEPARTKIDFSFSNSTGFHIPLCIAKRPAASIPQSRGPLPSGQGIPQGRICDHKFRLIKAADQIFCTRVVDGHFSADAAVRLRQYRSRNLDQFEPAHEGRSSKPCQITNHAA